MANLNLYKSFYDVVRFDGFTNASKATNISQLALSYSIKTLEKELNTGLLNNSFGIDIDKFVQSKSLLLKK